MRTITTSDKIQLRCAVWVHNRVYGVSPNHGYGGWRQAASGVSVIRRIVLQVQPFPSQR